jgi:ribonuclease P/MRP protein subunit RPP40
MSHLEKNKLISQEQHGFLPGKSCCTNLLEFMEKVTSAVDEGVSYDVIFLDFAKAFDKVPRERLLKKLSAHGIRGATLHLIRNWLTGRSQRVVLNVKSSSWEEVLSGDPQGSVLSPILFLIFINDLSGVARMIDAVRKFADDTKLGQRAGTVQDRECMQEALDNLCLWADRWGMQFNVSKCKVMHFGRNNVHQKYTMNGQELMVTEEEVDIGVKVTKNLKPAGQCQRAAKTAQSVLGQLSRAFTYRDRHVFMRLYAQYVRPYLEFAVQARSPWSEADKECLEKAPKRAVRMVYGVQAKDYEGRLMELVHLTLEKRRHQLDMQQVHRILTG